jgi:hypothetical protein
MSQRRETTGRLTNLKNAECVTGDEQNLAKSEVWKEEISLTQLSLFS